MVRKVFCATGLGSVGVAGSLLHVYVWGGGGKGRVCMYVVCCGMNQICRSFYSSIYEFILHNVVYYQIR